MSEATLSNLSPVPGSKHRRKRLGKGEGSGKGKTCGKGGKGQTARSGFGLPAGFEGGQMPIHRRLPKRGFISRKKLTGVNVYSTVRVDLLDAIAEGGVINVDILQRSGLLRSKNAKVKILGGAAVKGKLSVEVDAISKSAKEAIEAAGGEVKLLSAVS